MGNKTVYNDTLRCFLDQISIIRKSKLSDNTKLIRIEQLRIWYCRFKEQFTVDSNYKHVSNQ